MASAASVAAPDQLSPPPALRAARSPGTHEITPSPAVEATGAIPATEGAPATHHAPPGAVGPAGRAVPSDDPWAGLAPLGDPDGVADSGVAVPWPADPQRPAGEVPPWPDERPG